MTGGSDRNREGGSPTLKSTGTRKKKGRGIIVFLVIAAVLAGGVYLYRDSIPVRLLDRLTGSGKAVQPKVIYYCPMHPQYQSDKPGTCPICNMSLEKMEQEPAAGKDQAVKEATPKEGIPQGKRRILYYQDSMNPAYRSDKPGKAPDGMDLVPVYEEEGQAAEALPPGTVRINPQKQQLIGIQYGEVAKGPLSKTIHAVAKLAYDETKISRVQTRIDGWIERVFVDFTGQLVKKGQPLISIYSPQLVSTQRELLLAGKSRDTFEGSQFKEASEGAVSLYQSTLERLRLWNISDAQIREIEKRGAPLNVLTLSSPATGFVVARNAYPGQRITPETEIYSIADLSTIWAMAEVYEYEVPLIRMGQPATMTLNYVPGKTYTGKVTYIYPDVDKTTRTLKVRIEFPNPDYLLKPDMYANVDIAVDFGSRISIPQEAVLDSGTEQIAFVALDNGYFEPRRIQLGPKVGDRYIVTAGLKPGDKVVTSGNFLIDSESQLKSALKGMGPGPAADKGTPPAPGGEAESPVPGAMAPMPSQPEDHSQHQVQPSGPGHADSGHTPGAPDHSAHGPDASGKTQGMQNMPGMNAPKARHSGHDVKTQPGGGTK